MYSNSLPVLAYSFSPFLQSHCFCERKNGRRRTFFQHKWNNYYRWGKWKKVKPTHSENSDPTAISLRTATINEKDYMSLHMINYYPIDTTSTSQKTLTKQTLTSEINDIQHETKQIITRIKEIAKSYPRRLILQSPFCFFPGELRDREI